MGKIITRKTRSPVCPHCGFFDDWKDGMYEHMEVMLCHVCEKRFHVCTDLEKNYFTKKIKER